MAKHERMQAHINTKLQKTPNKFTKGIKAMSEFFMLTFVGALMIISPGPDFAVVVKNSLAYGRSSGLSASAGVALANLCHVAINLLGVGVIISQSVFAFTLMKILGAIYLIYLGYKGLRAKPAPKREATSGATGMPLQEMHPGLKNAFQSGFLTSLLNPKACLFYLSFFSVILSPAIPRITQTFYGIWISFIALLWFMLVALFFTSPMIGQRIQVFKHWLERFTGGVLMVFGLKLLSSEVP